MIHCLCVSVPLDVGLLVLEGGYGIFNVRNGFSASCVSFVVGGGHVVVIILLLLKRLLCKIMFLLLTIGT